MVHQKHDVKPAAAGSVVLHVTLKLQDARGNEIDVYSWAAGCPDDLFKDKSTTKFHNIANAYADNNNIDVSKLRFNIDGEPAVFEKAVGELHLVDDDVVDVEMKQIGRQAL
ncbi:hypothetical protein GGF31_003677 [Allomyces arbusculus]|nr:hypothetical protein GGF31_003677 [Allomyces arbusculus]